MESQQVNSEEKREEKVVVCGLNALGEPDFYFCKVIVSEDDYNLGIHYDAAEEKAAENRYEEPFISFDKYDAAGRAIMDHFTWESADVYDTTLNSQDSGPSPR